MSQSTRIVHSVEAFNVSHASENKIHDDTIAQKLGFSGGLVPGVEVFAYASHLPVATWGRAFLERGLMAARFAKPVYDGRTAVATGVETAEGLDLKVESDGELCATGTARLPVSSSPPPVIASWEYAPPPTDPAKRPPADETSLAEGRWLSTVPQVLDPQRHRDYLRDVRETLPLYEREQIAHPGILLRLCNSLLRENVVLPPWIHVGSEMTHFGVAKVGDALAARGRVVANYEKKGHRFVDLDCVLAAGDRTIARVKHTAIYKLRHLAV